MSRRKHSSQKPGWRPRGAGRKKRINFKPGAPFIYDWEIKAIQREIAEESRKQEPRD